MAIELKGAPVSEKIQKQITGELATWAQKKWQPPKLVVVLVGDDPASLVYVGHKEKMCQKLGFQSEVLRLPGTSTQTQVSEVVERLNRDKDVDGILVQLPLPSHIQSREIIEKIDAGKDVDCLTESNLGAILTGRAKVAPCTPSGVIEILKYYDISLSQKNVAVVGRSLIVGTPLFYLLNQEHATVTMFHSKSPDLKAQIKSFDIVCVAIGKAEFFQVSDFKKGAVVVDVGMHRGAHGLTGDVNFKGAETHLQAKTPVPGGVGPMTIAMLMKNTMELARVRRQS